MDKKLLADICHALSEERVEQICFGEFDTIFWFSTNKKSYLRIEADLFLNSDFTKIASKDDIFRICMSKFRKIVDFEICFQLSFDNGDIFFSVNKSFETFYIQSEENIFYAF